MNLKLRKKEIIELNNRKEVAEKEEVAEISLTQEEKEKEKKDLENKVRKLKKEIEKNNSKELIIDRKKGMGEFLIGSIFRQKNFKNRKKIRNQ